ncbi:tRNA dimethylallyltransferase [Salegentibacter echinorum]|uniref:tRNA dimethylallyltransferase n=1 Tax=Salegentibacter echinorum TaxID=1073325 RepID=A0A1M5FCX9_SALEC|nr:tRNA (adenosine(37)-N6)-dimethylallyltransferase MiaA [Salegentibacter echinorum]SHF89346.1 tRNA dimethylallyltransferase [Salegentibacter echinorum]
MMPNFVITAEEDSMKNKHLLNVVGPTAIGKTSLAIALAQHFKTEIISADSRQFFKEMNLGTAVPSKKELAAATHHFIQQRSIEDPYTVGDFETEALAKLNEIFTKNDVAVMVGGSGLYTKSVLQGLDHFPQVPPEIKSQLNKQFEEEGLKPLQEQLRTLDPSYFKDADIQNPQRVIRALAVSMSAGHPYSSYLDQPKEERKFKAISIGLTAEREVIYSRINYRVDLMMQAGLLEEAKALFPKRHLNALNTVGYKELFEFLKGNCSLETAVAEIKKNTRRFAKRQLTWFRKDPNIHWFDYKTQVEEIVDEVM